MCFRLKRQKTVATLRWSISGTHTSASHQPGFENSNSFEVVVSKLRRIPTKRSSGTSGPIGSNIKAGFLGWCSIFWGGGTCSTSCNLQDSVGVVHRFYTYNQATTSPLTPAGAWPISPAQNSQNWPRQRLSISKLDKKMMLESGPKKKQLEQKKQRKYNNLYIYPLVN